MIEYLPISAELLSGLCEVEEECFGSGFAMATFKRELENKIAVYVAAVENDRVLGYAGLWNVCGEADIMNVGVRKNARRQGIAENMIAELIKKCRDAGVFCIHLEVRESNIPARRLYEKLGFKENGMRKGYYDGKEDAVLMTYNIIEETK